MRSASSGSYIARTSRCQAAESESALRPVTCRSPPSQPARSEARKTRSTAASPKSPANHAQKACP